MSVRRELMQTRNYFEAIIMVIISFLFALLAIAIFIAILSFGGFSIDYGDLVKFAIIEILSDTNSIFQIIYWSMPLMLTGLSVAIAFQAGLFNIGGQGQLMIGAVFTAIWGAVIVPEDLTFLNSPFLLVTTSIIVGFSAGAFWGYIPGYLKAKTGAHEVITTIMMNLIAISFTTYLVGSQTYSPFIDKTSTDAYAQTDVISQAGKVNLMFPETSKFLNWTAVYTIIVVLIIHIIIYQTTFGYKIRAVGFNKNAAETAGIKSENIIKRSMALAGGVSGLAGAFYVLGTPPYRYVGGFEGTLGFDGIAVALIAQNSPLAIIIAALFFGFLQQSKNSLDFYTNIPPDLIFALQAWVIIFIAAPLLARKVYGYLQQRGEGMLASDEGPPDPELKESSVKEEVTK